MNLHLRKSSRWQRLAAWTLLEMMVATAVFSISGAAVGTAYLFSLRSFKALSNYSILDEQNREAMDALTKEVRQAYAIKASQNGSSASIVFTDANGKDITYQFDGSKRQFLRVSNNVKTVLLDDCSLIRFNMGKRYPTAVTNALPYDPTTDVNAAKILDLSWKTGRQLRGSLTNSENIQTAKIVLRKKGLAQVAP